MARRHHKAQSGGDCECGKQPTARLFGCFHPLHACIDNAIHSQAGVQLRLACAELMAKQGYFEPTGQAKITPAFNLPSAYVLHTVGPIISGALSAKDGELLASCYRSCLELAKQHGH
ncbi:macro domain-containing protein [Glaesserella parasuis]|nr:macro domain-containing protein [Glaesserella parasuis]MDD2173716.1 macro domain-containing protein [Glaesserella parasuis]MDE3966451.1 macro domain-containing protein [Glaesserella parasuis]MDE3989418.1 macro domain-containing protein [Glaesserella parasuis]MDE4004703.1 macro domain-containing protein [Glaesserella parasuis]MDE4017964.1 macro domain-containing protein [Glaesserella parasuis]